MGMGYNITVYPSMNVYISYKVVFCIEENLEMIFPPFGNEFFVYIKKYYIERSSNYLSMGKRGICDYSFIFLMLGSLMFDDTILEYEQKQGIGISTVRALIVILQRLRKK